jgi:O-antigen/teichoic acid export membrane protein
VKRLWYSPTLRSMVVYGASGLGFAGANLVLARVLPTDQYALFTLVIALGNLGYSLAPAGLDGVVNRQHLEAGPALLAQVLRPAVAIGLLFGGIGLLAYDMPFGLAAMLFVSSTLGGVMMVAGAKFQSEQRFGVSLAVYQSPNLVLLLAAALTVALHGRRAWLPVLISTVGFAAAAAYGWGVLLRERHSAPHRGSAFSWREALAFAGLGASGLLLIQLERLVIPHVLPLADLALYGVLGAIAGSLFRVLQMGVGYSLLPRLRAAGTIDVRRRLIEHEARLVIGIIVLGSAFIWFITPVVERGFLHGKYHLAGGLVLAAIVSGIGKIANSFTKAMVGALAEPHELSLVNVLGWASVGISLAAAFAGARWGLAGVIYGVALGWYIRAAISFALVLRHLRLPAALPATAP